MPAAFRRVALIGKLRSTDIASSLRELSDFLAKRGCEVLLEQDTAADLGSRGADYDTIGKNSDLAIVVGGDGTMLAAARSLVRHRVPVIGVNQGRVGFMTDIGHDDMQRGIGAVLDGKYSIEERALIEAEIRRGANSVLRTIALNEAVVSKGAQGRLIEFDLSLDGEFVYKLRGDGMIVATPTGSTAYEIALVRAVDARAHFDGFALTDMAQGDKLVLKRSADAVRFVHPPGYRYFATLREKLRWSEVLDKIREID
jgi:NAD+ kinase